MKSVVISSVLALASLAVAADAQNREWTDDKAFKDAVLNGTNTYRLQHDAKPLVWNNSLAQMAQDWVGNCDWKHSGGPAGENLATGYSSISSAITGWGDERDEYDFMHGDFDKSTGHFTQLVWQTTTSVGCARKHCGAPPRRSPRHLHHGRGIFQHDDEDAEIEPALDVAVQGRGLQGRQTKAWSWFLVCEYYPRGNYLGQFQENVAAQSNSNLLSGGSSGAAEGNGESQENDVFTNAGVEKAPRGMGAWLVSAIAMAVNAGSQ